MNKGFILPLVVVIIVIALIGGGAAYYLVSQQEQRAAATPSPLNPPPSSPTQNTGATTSPLVLVRSNAPVIFTGTVLAGSTAPLLDFTPADFALAKSSGKVIVLYFYANWCPICREEFPLAEAAFDQLTTPNVVGFRVNFNDNETDQSEKDLAREYGIPYQHTKVIIKNGQQTLKSPETWDTARYITEITNAAR